MRPNAAAGGFAVDGDRFKLAAFLRFFVEACSALLGPACKRSLERDGIESRQEFAKRWPSRWCSMKSQGMNQAEILVVHPLRDRLEAACTAEDGTTDRGQHCRQGMTPPMSRTRVGYRTEVPNQTGGLVGSHECNPWRVGIRS